MAVEHVDRVIWRRALRALMRVVFAPLWLLFWPLRAAMPRLQTWGYRTILGPGERILAVDVTLGPLNDYWLASNEAVYIEPTPSRTNQRERRYQRQRIPYSWIESVTEVDRGAFTERTLRCRVDSPALGEVITDFINKTFEGKIVNTINAQLPKHQPPGQLGNE